MGMMMKKKVVMKMKMKKKKELTWKEQIYLKKMEKAKGSKRFEDENYATLCQTRDDAYKTKGKLMSYDLLEAPQVVRKYVLKTFASK